MNKVENHARTLAVAYLGGGYGAMSSPFRATINFFSM